MARDFQIGGPTLVKVTGGQHMSGHAICNPSELGLTTESVTVEPRFRYRDVGVDDFGPEVPAEVQWMLSDALIRMTLVHHDWNVLDICMIESMAGGGVAFNDGGVNLRNPAGGDLLFLRSHLAGNLAPAGSLMGNGLPMFASGNHYVSLNLTSPVNRKPWRFRSCYLAERPVVYPVGVKCSEVQLTWRAIPYAPIYFSGTFQSEHDINSPKNTSGVSMDETFRKSISTVSGGSDYYYLRKEITSSGVCLWDRFEDV
jgi:hypothetical protein